MVRARKTQPIQVPTGRAYGEARAIEESQRAVPLPQQAAPPPAPAQTPAAQPNVQRPDIEQILREYQMPAARLAGPSQRPTEPITAGLMAGAGPGPEVLGQRTTISNAYRQLATDTADPDIAYLADLVGRLGL